jgi:arylsulfatase A-like enzyme
VETKKNNGKYFFLLIILTIFFIILSLYYFQNNPFIPEKKYDLSCEGCNVIFINVELLRADHVDLINSDKNITPNINAFFNKGVIFTNVRSPAGATYNSITSVFTGLEQKINEHKNPKFIKNDGLFLIDLVPIIPQILKQKNYATISLDMGGYSGNKVNLDRGYDNYLKYDQTSTNSQIQDAIIAIKNFKKNSELFFSQIHFNTLHYPYNIPKELVPVIKPNYKIIGDNIRKVYKIPLSAKVITTPFDKNESNDIMYTVKVNGEEKNYLVSDYNEMREEYETQVTYVDYELKQLFDFLKDNNYLDNTIVILFSNHGEGLFDNGVPNHGVCYESCVHVPLLIRHPKIKEQIIINDQVGLIDLAPTLYDILNIQIDYNISGKSFYNELMQTGNITREYTYTSSNGCEYITKDNLKLIIKSGGIKEFYDLNTDPYETNNLYSKNNPLIRDFETELIKQEINSLILLDQLKERFGN